ncbi:MAG: hydantoinase B/oxoprolinase family protein [Planctomycetota bacterium]
MGRAASSRGDRPRGRGERRAAAFDPLEVEVFGHLFASLCEEMGAVLVRAAFSANIVERRDFSCALFDGAGRLVAQAAHLPVHLGAARASVEAVLGRAGTRGRGLRRGDVWLLNDPFAGGSHLPDLTLVAPVFLGSGDAPDFLLVDRAHHADVGGPFPGSMGPAPDAYWEGLRIPPVRLARDGEVDADVLDLFLANVRVPTERRGDLLAQRAALALGESRLRALAEEYGADVLRRRADGQIAWTAELAARAIGKLADGRGSARDTIELANGGGVELCADVEVRGERLEIDLTRCGDQVAAPLNAPRAVAESAVFYVVRLLLTEDTPTNHGVLAPLRLTTRPGSVVDAVAPAAVAAGNTETSQRLVDVLVAALGPLVRDGLPAPSNGSMSNLSFGSGRGASESFTHYETHGGGAGAGPSGDGESGIHCHMTNTRNTPIESIEREMPVRILRTTLRRGSGGDGARRGGDGIEKEIEFDEPVRVSWLSGRRTKGPAGARGGGAGEPGSARVSVGATVRELEPQDSAELPRGARIEVRTPGGGGFER